MDVGSIKFNRSFILISLFLDCSDLKENFIEGGFYLPKSLGRLWVLFLLLSRTWQIKYNEYILIFKGIKRMKDTCRQPNLETKIVVKAIKAAKLFLV